MPVILSPWHWNERIIPSQRMYIREIIRGDYQGRFVVIYPRGDGWSHGWTSLARIPYFSIMEEAMADLDRLVLEHWSATFLTEEQWTKYQVLR